MNPQRTLPLLIAIMAAIVMAVTCSTLYILYRVSFDLQSDRLTETVKSTARMIEAIFEHETKFAHRIESGIHGDAYTATLEQIIQSHKQFEGFGKTEGVNLTV